MKAIVFIDQLRKALNQGVVNFTFIKKDGTLRHARGTTSPHLIPTDNTPKGARTPSVQALYEQQVVTFYDIDKKGWRSMQISTIWSVSYALTLE